MLCNFLSEDMLLTAPQMMTTQQKFLTAGGFLGEKRNQCWAVEKDSQPQPLPPLWSNAEETDLRQWLHCKHSNGNHKLLYSPDTDTYHIGLPLLSQWEPQPDVYIQLKGTKDQPARYMNLSKFLQSLDTDPELAQVPSHLRP